MDDESSKLATLLKQMIVLEQRLVKLQASVSVLRSLEAQRRSPDNVLVGLEALDLLDAEVLKRDPRQTERQEAIDLIRRLENWKKTGGQSGES